MDIRAAIKTFEKLILDNSPTILTSIGVLGLISTGVFAAQGGVKSERLLSGFDYEMTFKEEIEHTWQFYIPAATSGAISIAAIIGANRIGMRRAAALAAAYSLSEKAFTEYKDKVVERLGEKKEQTLRDDIAQDRVLATPSTQVIVTDSSKVLCQDGWSGRYFESSMEALKKAQNDLNFKMLHDGYASVSDFYSLVGLPITGYSEEVGWNNDKPMELDISTVLSEDGKPCLAINFHVIPVRNYWKAW